MQMALWTNFAVAEAGEQEATPKLPQSYPKATPEVTSAHFESG
jgi:hypothetical protein